MLDVATADYFVSEVLKSGAKLLPLGDNNQNQAIGSKGAFARMVEVGNRNILTEVNRHQNTDSEIKSLHIAATSALCNRDVSKAISIYDSLGKINIFATEKEKEVAIARRYVSRVMEIAKSESIDICDAAKDLVISAYTNSEIKTLNDVIRDSLKNAGVLVNSKRYRSGGLHGNSSMVDLAEGDRIIFTRNVRAEDSSVIVLNNELATVRKLLKVNAMGCGEFLVDVEGASGTRCELIKTGEEGKIVTFKHGYAITNHAVQGASVPYKMYSVDQYSGSSSFLVGLTRHKLDCEIFAARDTLENEVFKTKDLDVEKVQEEYRAICYEYKLKSDDNGNQVQVKEDIELWKVGLHLLVSKSNDLNFAIDSSYGSVSIKLQENLQAQRDQLDGLRQDLLSQEKALSDFEAIANKPLLSIKGKRTQFELFVLQDFVLKEKIFFNISDVMDAPMKFKNDNISSEGESLKIEDHVSALKAGVMSNGDVMRLNWLDLSKNDQDLLLWSYLDQEDRKKLEAHYIKARNLVEEIQDKARGVSSIWQELQESGFKSHDVLDGNYKIVSDYLAARVRVRDAFEQEGMFNKQLRSAKIQKELVAAINNKYSLKLKFIYSNINGIKKAGEDFEKKKSSLDSERLLANKSYIANSLEQDRELHLHSLKNSDFKEQLKNSNLFVLDIMESAKEGTALSDLGNSIIEAKQESDAAKSEREVLAGLIIKNWDGHIDEDAAKSQPSFERIAVQMSFNRLTLLKHAGINQQKHYFDKLFPPTLGKNKDYHEIMHMIFKVCDSELKEDDISILLKAHDGLCEYVELVNEYLLELKDEKSSLQSSINFGLARLEEIETYQKTELPHLMEMIYNADGKVIISNLDKMLAGTKDKAQLCRVISDNPEMLGSLKANSFISRVFGSKERKVVEANLGSLYHRIERYIKGKTEMQELQQGVGTGDYAKKLIAIEKEIEVLRSSLPSSDELNILEEIGVLQDSVLKNGSNQQDINKFSKQVNKLLLTDNAQDILFTYQAKNNVFFESASKNENNNDNEEAVINPETVKVGIKNGKKTKLPSDGLKQRFKKKANIAIRKKQQYNKPSLTFAEVRAGLNSSVVSEIFHYYGTSIVPDKAVKKQGNGLQVGTLTMSISGNKMGLWHRFSSGEGGDIFSFVEEATGCSSKEALEIVASRAGVIATTKDELRSNKLRSKRKFAASKDMSNRKTPKRINADWVASAIVPETAAKFNANKDLSFLVQKGNIVSLVHEYKNKDNQLLGFTVRIEDSKTGKKQVLPISYCYNEAQGKSRWRLKGFSDSGTKPIYGLEKLAKHKNRPILIVEGEKTADAASKILPNYNVISWMGGAQGVTKVDWSKMSNRVVIIWPDNDNPGIAASRNIVNQIDYHNGFSGLVSVVDTEKLNLPKKWDLADKLSIHLEKIGVAKILEQTVSMQNRGTDALVKNHSKKIKQALDSIDILEAQGRIDQEKYLCKATYHATLVAIAINKNIDLLAGTDEFMNNVLNLQEEYRDLQKTYKFNILQEKHKSGTSPDRQGSISTKDEVKRQIVENISILHMAQMNREILPKLHIKHIEASVRGFTQEMKRFANYEKAHVAGKVLRAIDSANWRDRLDAANLEKTSDLALRFTAKTIDDFLTSTKSSYDNKASIHLENIRKYGIDESVILETFRTSFADGNAALQEMSNKVTIARGLVLDHSKVIDEAHQWGYKGSNIDLTKSLIGMDEKTSYDHINDIRNKYLEKYLEVNFSEIKAHNNGNNQNNNFEDQKVIISKEQNFLRQTFDQATTSENLSEYKGNIRDLLLAGRSISRNPEKLEKFFKQCEHIKFNNMRLESDLCADMVCSRDIDVLIKKASTTIEYYNVNNTLYKFDQEKKLAKTPSEILSVIGKEQAFVRSLQNKNMVAELGLNILDSSILESLTRDCNFLVNSKMESEEKLLSIIKNTKDLKSTADMLFKESQPFIEAMISSDLSKIEDFDERNQGKEMMELVVKTKEKHREFLPYYMEDIVLISQFEKINNRVEIYKIVEETKLSNPKLAIKFKKEMDIMSKFNSREVEESLALYKKQSLEKVVTHAKNSNKDYILGRLEHESIIGDNPSLKGQGYVELIAKDKDIMGYIDQAVSENKKLDPYGKSTKSLIDYTNQRDINNICDQLSGKRGADKFKDRIIDLQRFGSSKELQEGLRIYKTQGIDGLSNYTEKICTNIVSKVLGKDLIGIEHGENIESFDNKFYHDKSDYLSAIIENKQLMKYIEPDSRISRAIESHQQNQQDHQQNKNYDFEK